ncbi:MAG: HEPN domain-containing protein [Bacteroidales bacterium]|nr:HEPN domain-containing protein [Bacteroidales bacterium]
MGLNEIERKVMVEYKFQKAIRTLEQAKGNIELKYWEVIANILNYAAYYAVSALLLANKISVKTHNGVIQMFGMKFVKTNIVDAELGKLYNRLFSLRLTGDYNDSYTLSEDDVVSLVEPTEKFIVEIKKLSESPQKL